MAPSTLQGGASCSWPSCKPHAPPLAVGGHRQRSARPQVSACPDRHTSPSSFPSSLLHPPSLPACSSSFNLASLLLLLSESPLLPPFLPPLPSPTPLPNPPSPLPRPSPLLLPPSSIPPSSSLPGSSSSSPLLLPPLHLASSLPPLHLLLVNALLAVNRRRLPPSSFLLAAVTSLFFWHVRLLSLAPAIPTVRSPRTVSGTGDSYCTRAENWPKIADMLHICVFDALCNAHKYAIQTTMFRVHTGMFVLHTHEYACNTH